VSPSAGISAVGTNWIINLPFWTSWRSQNWWMSTCLNFVCDLRPIIRTEKQIRQKTKVKDVPQELRMMMGFPLLISPSVGPIGRIDWDMEIWVTYVPPFQGPVLSTRTVRLFFPGRKHQYVHTSFSNLPRADFLPAFTHCQNSRSLFPIPYNLDDNVVPDLLSVDPIRRIDRRSWLGYEYLSDMHILGLLFHRSFHFPFWTNS
jgi:hypothetical protein